MTNTIRLVWRTTKRAPLKAITLAVLLAVAIIVFALITELSRVSEQGLDQGIARDSGEFGTYEVTFSDVLGPERALRNEVADAVAASLNAPIMARWEDLPKIASECPPYSKVGDTNFRVLSTPDGAPAQLPYGETDGIDTRWCLGGVEIPQSGFYLPGEAERATLGSIFYLQPTYADLVRLSSKEPSQYGVTLHVGRDDALNEISTTAAALLTDTAARYGVAPSDLVSVIRVDQDADSVRAAADGISTTYDLMRWAVLGLAAAAIVAMQTTTASHRSWFYGLARAMGARSRTIVAVIATESVAIVVAGSALALTVLAAGNGAIADFARTAFGVNAHVFHPAMFVSLIVGLGAAMAAAISVPLIAVLRRDPLDVLEAPRN